MNELVKVAICMKNFNKFIFSDTNKRYHTYDYYLKNKFKTKCVKIPLNCGFTCPNIDGTKGYNGCTYCSGTYTNTTQKSVTEQFYSAKETLRTKWGDTKYILYFQAYTNTYAPLDILKPLYEEALSLPDVVGINIATRADALENEIVGYLHELSQRTFLTIELGLQTVHDVTAERINRCHSYEEFLIGYNKLKSKGINACIHIINGLPRETKSMMLETVREIARIHPHGIKIHLLHILKGTVIADQYLRGEFNILTLDEYIAIVVSQLELLPPDIYIGRLTGDGDKDELIAPLWSRNKRVVLNEIDKCMAKMDTYQGILCN